MNKPCFATSRGEVMEEISLDLSGYSFVLVNPGININTGWAFSALTSEREDANQLHFYNHGLELNDIVHQPIRDWPNLLYNDFEGPVFKKHPEIKAVKDQLYSLGALYASMSGSGSTVYGIFEQGWKNDKLTWKDERIVRIIENRTATATDICRAPRL